MFLSYSCQSFQIYGLIIFNLREIILFDCRNRMMLTMGIDYINSLIKTLTNQWEFIIKLLKILNFTKNLFNILISIINNLILNNLTIYHLTLKYLLTYIMILLFSTCFICIFEAFCLMGSCFLFIALLL